MTFSTKRFEKEILRKKLEEININLNKSGGYIPYCYTKYIRKYINISPIATSYGGYWGKFCGMEVWTRERA